MEIETVKIQTPPSDDNPTGIVIINKSDFDPEAMTLADGEAAPEVKSFKAMNKADLQQFLTDAGVPFDGSMTKAELLSLCEAAE